MTQVTWMTLLLVVLAAGCSRPPVEERAEPKEDLAAQGDPIERAAEDKAAAFVEKRGGKVTRDGKTPGTPVITVALGLWKLTDADQEEYDRVRSQRKPGDPQPPLPKSAWVSDIELRELAAFKHLSTLSVGYRPITDAGMKELAKLKSLKEIHGVSVDQPDESFKDLAPLTNLSTLSIGVLDLFGRHLTDRKLAALREANLLQTLVAASAQTAVRPAKPEDVTTFRAIDSKVTDAGLKELAPLRNLSALHLDGTKVTGSGFKDLAAFPDLTELGLGRTEVTDEWLKDLAPLKNLTKLILGATKVTDAGVKELQNALPNCKIVR